MIYPKRILILYADVGFGHRSAANAIAVALKEKYADQCLIEIANPLDDERTPAFLRDSQTDYDKLVRDMPEYYKIRYKISDNPVPNAIVENVTTVMLFTVIKDIIQHFKPDVVITTHPMYPAPLGAVIAVQNLKISYFTVVTDLVDLHISWFHDSADLFLVPTMAAYWQALDYGLPKEKVIVTGIPVHPDLTHDEREKPEIRRELDWQADLRTVLVVGSKRTNNLQEVLHVLNHSGLPMQMAVVAGGDDRLFNSLKKVEWHGPVHLYNYVDNMPALMLASDLVISKAGGLIVTESLACGLPLLLIDVTPGQEMGNAEFVIKNRAGEIARSPVEALEKLFHWMDNDQALLEKYQNKARSLGRPKAAYSIADLAWSAAVRGPVPLPASRAHMLPKLLALLSTSGITEKDDGTSGPEDEMQIV